MRKLFCWAAGVPLLCLLLVCTNAPKASAQDVTVSFQSFYDNLAPYGQWIYDPQYGNVFVPYEDPSFRPYTRGYWVMTEYGNTWVSEDPWGWACYHYGRWTFNSYYGWIWIPGYEWAPAWVSWRWGRGYSGWAPLGPGIYAGDGYYCPDTWWVFVEPRYMYAPRWHDYWEGPERNRYYVHRTQFMNNYEDAGSHNYGHYNYNYGPRAEIVQRETHLPVQIYKVSNSGNPGTTAVGGNTVNMYRPSVDRNSVNTAKPAAVIQAPHPIVGKGEPAPRQVNSNTVPTFRQEHPTVAQPPVRNNPPVPQHGNYQQPQPPVHNNQPEPQHNNPAPPAPPIHNQPEPQRYNNPAPPQPPVHNQPEPQRYNNPAPPAPPVHNQPEPQRYNNPAPPQPPVRNQPEPQRFNNPAPPQPPVRNQPEPQRANPQPPMQHSNPRPPQPGQRNAPSQAKEEKKK